jgi:flagellar biosynthesis protein FliP
VTGIYSVGLLIALALFVITLVMIPVQYRYIKAMEEEKKKKKRKSGEVFDTMPFGEAFLHQNAQSNPLFLPANLIAYIIYRMKNKGN